MSRFHDIRLSMVGLLLLVFLVAPVDAQSDRSNGKSFSGRLWQKLNRIEFPDVHERSHRSVVSAFRDVVEDARLSTVRILGNGEAVALGTVVSSDGLILTKASEMRGVLTCLTADGRRLDAIVATTDRDFDLALLRVNADNLVAARWANLTPNVGAFLASSDVDADPTAIGVVSAATRRMPPAKAVLGVRLEHTRGGPRVFEIVPDSAAARAALQIGDVIMRLNGQVVGSPQAVSQTIGQFRPGERVELAVLRGERQMDVTALLGDFSILGNEQAAIMEDLGGPLSTRRSGFPVVLQHDSVLRPRDCGGPIVDLDGNVVGVNIARVSRVASFAIPADTVRSLVRKMQADLVAQDTAAGLHAHVGHRMSFRDG